MMAIVTKLKELGWYLSGSGIEDCKAEADSMNVNKIVEAAKDTDLKDIGEGWLPADVNKGKCEQVQGPGVLQIQKIRNVTAPKDNEESNYAPRMLKLVLTDGQMNCNAVEMEKLERIGLDTCPGSKICLNGKVEVEHGFLKLYNRNVRFVGGRVDKMADNWELRKKLSRQVRVYVGSEGGPPAFTPFGQKTKDKKPVAFKKVETQNFKSLETQTKEKKSEDAEFEQQRKAIIAEALQAKEEGKSINFGGQKQIGQDKDIARIVEMGFSASQASHALQQSNGDVNQAIDGLLNNERKPGGGDLRRERDGRREIPSRDDRRERGGRGRGRDNAENEDGEKSSRPSGPATLFDFLETKIKPEKDSKDSKERPRNSQPLQSFDNSSNRSGDNRTYNDRREPPMKQSERNDNRYNNRKSEYQQNDRSERSKPSYDSDRPFRNDDRGGSSYNSDRSYKNNDHGGSSYDSDRSYRNERGGSSYENKRGQGYRSEKPDRYETDRGKDRGQQRPPADKGGNNDRKGRENKPQRGNNSDQANRPRTGYQDRRQGNQQDYQQNRPRSEMSSQDSRQKSQNPQNQAESRENFDSAGNQFNKSNRYFQQPPPSLPQFNPDVPPPPLLQQFNNYVPNQGGFNATWKRGDRCMAKYWEDNKFYSAVVENIDPRYPTVVVHFLEYGNSEEVSLSDVRPDPQFMGSMGNQGPSPLPQQQNASRTAEDSKIRSMEFRRKRQDQDNKQQKLYQPPNQQPLY